MLPANTNCAVWVVAHTTGIAPHDLPLIVELFDVVQERFTLSRPIHASYGPGDAIVIADPREWIAVHAARLARDHLASPDVPSQMSMWCTHKLKPTWTLEVHNFPLLHTLSPTVCLRLDLSAAKDHRAVQSLADAAALSLMKSPRCWYGFIDINELDRIPLCFYSNVGTCYSGSWEHLVEQDLWLEYALAERRTVRNVYWGNILGPELANRLRNAGYESFAARLDETTPGGRPVEVHANSGAMALFLDDDPVAFAKNRASGLGDTFGSMSRCVKTASMLRWVMSRAGML